MTDWNPNDPDATRVYYDLTAWSFDQQAELASAMAEADIPHAWEGTELMVPDESELAADVVIAEVEERLGIQDAGIQDDGIQDDGIQNEDAPLGTGAAPVELADGVPTTEFDLADWSPAEHEAVSHALADAGIAFRWDAGLLLVGTDDEAVVDTLLDEIESGEYADVLAASTRDDAVDEASAEVLTTFFLAAERLRREPLDADGIEHLMRALDEADTDVPPFGVTPRMWTQIVELADRLADALAADEQPDEEAAMAAAEQLHELLRPNV